MIHSFAYQRDGPRQSKYGCCGPFFVVSQQPGVARVSYVFGKVLCIVDGFGGWFVLLNSTERERKQST